jgi:hypothetical protein
MFEKDSTSNAQPSCAKTPHGFDCLIMQRDDDASCKGCSNRLRPEKLRAMVGVKKRAVLSNV